MLTRADAGDPHAPPRSPRASRCRRVCPSTRHPAALLKPTLLTACARQARCSPPLPSTAPTCHLHRCQAAPHTPHAAHPPRHAPLHAQRAADRRHGPHCLRGPLRTTPPPSGSARLNACVRRRGLHPRVAHCLCHAPAALVVLATPQMAPVHAVLAVRACTQFSPRPRAPTPPVSTCPWRTSLRAPAAPPRPLSPTRQATAAVQKHARCRRLPHGRDASIVFGSAPRHPLHGSVAQAPLLAGRPGTRVRVRLRVCTAAKSLSRAHSLLPGSTDLPPTSC